MSGSSKTNQFIELRIPLKNSEKCGFMFSKKQHKQTLRVSSFNKVNKHYMSSKTKTMSYSIATNAADMTIES